MVSPPETLAGAAPVRAGSGEFAGRSVLVTGASRGIGLEVASLFRAAGARLTITARDPERLAAAATSLGGEPDVLTVAGRSDDAASRAEVVATAHERFGGLDVVVLNVGTNRGFGALLDLDLDAARRMTEVNVVATLGWLQAVRAAAPDAMPSSVVIVASAAGQRPSPGIGFYGATKAALVHLTAQLATELAPDVRVNAVAPAVVRTAFSAVLFEDEAATVARYPLGRLGEPVDVAEAVLFLAGPRSAWITGQTLTLDGGLLLGGGV